MKRIEAGVLPVHGGLDVAELRRLGVDPETIVDFSVCTNPYGPSPLVREAIAAATLDRYPDRACDELRQALAETQRIDVDSILCGNGVSELIWLVALSLLHAGDRVLILGPTYSEYARASALVGAAVIERLATQHDHFAIPISSVETDLAKLQPRLVFLCNPNNPTGIAMLPEVIERWACRHPDTWFVVDEAYVSFGPTLASMLERRRHNVIVLRSMTKDYGLAALRLGYAVGSPELIQRLAGAQPPWSVNALAQAAGIAALRDREHFAGSLRDVAAATESLRAGLRGLGLAPLASAVHFFLVRVGDAASLRAALLQRGILVRDAASFGLPAHLRIAPRRAGDNDRLLAALTEVMR